MQVRLAMIHMWHPARVWKWSSAKVSGTLSHTRSLMLSTVFASSFSSSSDPGLPSKPIICEQAHLKVFAPSLSFSCHFISIASCRNPPRPLHHLNRACLATSGQPSTQKAVRLSHIRVHNSSPPPPPPAPESRLRAKVYSCCSPKNVALDTWIQPLFIRATTI